MVSHLSGDYVMRQVFVLVGAQIKVSKDRGRNRKHSLPLVISS